MPRGWTADGGSHQDHDLDNDFSVEETVAMGRLPHKRLLERDTTADRDIVHDALSRVGMAWAAHRVFARLSGGERQRVLVARALTQQTPVLLLDEPTNHLDIGAQHDLLELVRGPRAHDRGGTARPRPRHRLLRPPRPPPRRVITSGTPADVLTADRVAEVFGVRSAVVAHPITGRPHFVIAPVTRHPGPYCP